MLAYDAVDGAVLLQRPGSSPFHTHLSVVKLAALGEVLESRQPAGPPPAPPAVDEARTQDRLERALRAAKVQKPKPLSRCVCGSVAGFHSRTGPQASRSARTRRASAVGAILLKFYFGQ